MPMQNRCISALRAPARWPGRDAPQAPRTAASGNDLEVRCFGGLGATWHAHATSARSASAESGSSPAPPS